MFLITFNFTKDLPTEAQLIEHRSYIDEKINQGQILLAGPKDPRTGGVIISQIENQQQAEQLIKGDPYHRDKLADYQLTKFNAIKYHQEIEKLIK